MMTTPPKPNTYKRETILTHWLVIDCRLPAVDYRRLSGPTRMAKTIITFLFAFLTTAISAQTYRTISAEDLRDKIHGYWIGQLAGNYVGFPFENIYTEEAIPVLVDRYYNFGDADSLSLKMNLEDRRAYINILAEAMGGAWSDDDTDIEFVTLHAVEQYGLDLTYPEITRLWKAHINRFIWSANRKARDLMDEGLTPPATGSKVNNDYWYRITSQLVNEIWGAFYPGMTCMAGERSEWGARIMCDDWAVHATKAYGIMYSAAFFEQDVHKLVRLALDQLPDTSPLKRGVNDLIRWQAAGNDWRETRRLMHEKYYREIDGFVIPYPVAGSVINALGSFLALLYGDGDFTKTIAIATSAGYDCDNQAATCGGLMGILHGAKAIPEHFTLELPIRGRWTKPFNDQYINYSRDGLPNFNRISDIVERIMAVTERAILEQGGQVLMAEGRRVYRVKTDLTNF